jgi:NAD(P)-dependent dehydrogenase (short-subunit alcohol dehydrogenase family)
MRLRGRAAVVTGGSSGIGRAIALGMAREGAAIVIADSREQPREGGLSTAEAISTFGGRCLFVKTRVEQAGEGEQAISAAVKAFGGLDILVTAAGVVEPTGSTVEIDKADFERNLAVNVIGTFLFVQAGINYLTASRYGRVILVSSTSGLVGVGNTAAYCASKAAVIGLMRALAVEFGEYGLTVNALCPGATETAMGNEYRQRPGVLSDLERSTPLRLHGDRFVANPTEIAQAALFLASDDARFMTGACLVIDGGLTTK